jgi:hypothetical protein
MLAMKVVRLSTRDAARAMFDDGNDVDCGEFFLQALARTRQDQDQLFESVKCKDLQVEGNGMLRQREAISTIEF